MSISHTVSFCFGAEVIGLETFSYAICCTMFESFHYSCLPRCETWESASFSQLWVKCTEKYTAEWWWIL